MPDDRTDSHESPHVDPPVDSLPAELMRQRLHERMFGEPAALPQIARFRVIERIGSGGMGTVYLAWDEGLARSIALKFLHQREGDALVHEAQALARLAHPNVVSVFDVGVQDGRVWLAMEHVSGRTLRDWQRSGPPQAERLAHWIAAGRGLAAVHEAGLIHRDVKPDNVLLGDDGRVRLIDFGLVLAYASLQSTSSSSGDLGASTESRRIGFAGSRAYAAPEQLAGGPLDARADQYAYCVSVWESLAGERPERDDGGALLAVEPAGVPRRAVAALRRGLAVKPDHRWPSMSVLLDALEPRRRRVDLVLAVALATGLGLAAGLAGQGDSLVAEDPCVNAGSGLDASDAAVLAEGPLRSATEEWIGEWQRSSLESCAADASKAVHDQRSACLERRRLELRGLLEHLTHVRAGELTLDPRKLELGDPQACLRAPDEALALPVEHAETIASLRHALSEIERRDNASAATLIAETEPLLEQARAIAWAPVIAETELMRARLQLHANDRAAALASSESALDLAEQHGQSDLAAQAWNAMTRISLNLDLDPEAALRAWKRQRAALERLDARPLDRGRLASQLAWIATLRGDPSAAEQALREAVDEFEHAGLSGRLELVATLARLAVVLGAEGSSRAVEADEFQARARALEHELAQTRDPGPGVASSADAAFDRSQVAFVDGDQQSALAELEHALSAYERLGGSESLQVARVHVALAQVCDALGDFDRAERHAQRADEICLARLGANHPQRAASLSALGTSAYRRGDSPTSVRAFRVALRIEQTRPGGGGIDLAFAHSNLAEALLVGAPAGWPEARRQAEQALNELEALLPPDHPELAYPHKALGWAMLEMGELMGAEQHLTRALELGPWSDVEANEIRALLARIR